MNYRNLKLVHSVDQPTRTSLKPKNAAPQIGGYTVETYDDTSVFSESEPCQLRAYFDTDIYFGFFEFRQGERVAVFEVVGRIRPEIEFLDFHIEVPDAGVIRGLAANEGGGVFRNSNGPYYEFDFDLTKDTPVFKIDDVDVLATEPNSGNSFRM